MRSAWPWLVFALLAVAVGWSQLVEPERPYPTSDATAAAFAIAIERGQFERASDLIAGGSPADGWRPDWRTGVRTHILAQRFEAAARQLDAVVDHKDPLRSEHTREALHCLAAAAHAIAREEGIQTLHEHRAHEVCGTLYMAMSPEHVAFNRPRIDHVVGAQMNYMDRYAGALVVAEVSPCCYGAKLDVRSDVPILTTLGLMHAALAPTSRAREKDRAPIQANLDDQYARLGVGFEPTMHGALDPEARAHADHDVRGSSSAAPLETIARLRHVAIEANDAAWLAELDEDRDRWVEALRNREVSLLLSVLDTVY